MSFIDGLLIGILAIFGIVLHILNSKIRDLSSTVKKTTKETEQHFKEVHYAFINITSSIEAVSSLISDSVEKYIPNTTLKNKIDSSTERFLKVRELTEEQFSLFSSVQSPSASASHSKHKNEIIEKLKSLEEEKRNVMKSLLDDGIDPEITVMDDTGFQKTMKMSEALSLPIGSEDKTTDQKTPRKKDGNIIKLFNDEDNDDTSSDNPRDPTIH